MPELKREEFNFYKKTPFQDHVFEMIFNEVNADDGGFGSNTGMNGFLELELPVFDDDEEMMDDSEQYAKSIEETLFIIQKNTDELINQVNPSLFYNLF